MDCQVMLASGVTVHLSLAGSLEVTMLPYWSTPTHSLVNGQEIELTSRGLAAGAPSISAGADHVKDPLLAMAGGASASTATRAATTAQTRAMSRLIHTLISLNN